MSIIEAIILGIIQGLTEFLPVSSSGHIEIGKAFLNIKSADDMLFTLVVHAATVLSILVVFRRDIAYLFRHFFSKEMNDTKKYIGFLAVSAIPIGVVGLLLEDQLEALFSGNLLLVGLMLICTGLILLLTRKERKNAGQVTWKTAILIGLAQVIAILPGISRSGTTISAALALGVNRENAARFSFLMILAPIIGATLLKFIKISDTATWTPDTLLPYIIGFVAAFLSGLWACSWMVQLVKKQKIVYFSAYCVLAGLLVLGVSFFN